MSTMTLSPTSTFNPSGQVRLTRRGRVVVFIATLMLVAIAALFLGNASVATNHAGVDQPTKAITVESGDTLWAIASDLADDGEIREMVHQIRELNALDSAMLVAGQELYLPID